MTRTKLQNPQIALFVWLTATLLSLTNSEPGLAILEFRTSPEADQFPLNLEQLFKLPNDGAGGQRFSPSPSSPPDDDHRPGAGTRNPGLLDANNPLTALVPATNIGWTVAAHPTFWVYVPASERVEFVLRDANDNEIYRTSFEHTNNPGIISIRLPETVAPLKVGEKYRWSFSLFCKNNSQKDANTVGAWIKRVPLSPELKSQLDTATPRECIGIYAENGLWYDTLTTLAELYYAWPTPALKADWVSLLRHPSVRLDEIVSKSLVQCYTLENTLLHLWWKTLVLGHKAWRTAHGEILGQQQFQPIH